MTKIAINGFGRIGRMSLKIAIENQNIEIAAINDLMDIKTLVHLLKYDSNYGIYKKEINFDNDRIIIGDKEIKILSQRDPELLPWKELGIDVVLECTGFFTTKTGSEKHIKAGAKKVVISAPCKDDEVKTLILGVNEDEYDFQKDCVVSNGSCTTNCLAPIVKVLNDNIGIENGFMTTVHSYTNDQRILDLPHKDLRRARAAAISMIPTTTGAASATTKAIPSLKGKLDGIAIRVPTPVVSIVDFTAVVKREVSCDEVNNIFIRESRENLKGILSVSKEPLVSVDYKKSPFSSIVDLQLTKVIDNLVKISAWYDNEFGYACRLVEMADFVYNSKYIQMPDI